MQTAGPTRRSRRTAIRALFGMSAAVTVGCSSGVRGAGTGTTGSGTADGDGVVVFRRSVRKKRGVSQAAKKHAANRLYRTREAAEADPAHPGDDAYVVPVVISAANFAAWFDSPEYDVVDLREILEHKPERHHERHHNRPG